MSVSQWLAAHPLRFIACVWKIETSMEKSMVHHPHYPPVNYISELDPVPWAPSWWLDCMTCVFWRQLVYGHVVRNGGCVVSIKRQEPVDSFQINQRRYKRDQMCQSSNELQQPSSDLRWWKIRPTGEVLKCAVPQIATERRLQMGISPHGLPYQPANL